MTAQKWAVDIRGVSKRYGAVAALDGVSLTVGSNEFFTLLGPSGCGKTTMLRVIAGFEQADAGEIFLFGEEIEKRPPHRRPINTVFQHYALFPHMTVLENVLFGLRMLNVPRARAARRAAAVLEMVRLSGFAARRPAQLSGGQQQRVALARALAPEPKVLLLDESLSALDLKLRQAMRMELKQLQRDTGITFIFVTHDQDEALTMSDRIAVMAAGAVRQVGRPREIYDAPVDRFVADFIGEVNLLPGKVDDADFVLEDGGRIALAAAAAGDESFIAVRPEKARIVAAGGDLRGAVARNVYIGAVTETHVRLARGRIFAVRSQNASAAAREWEVGAEVGVVIAEGAARPLRG